MASGDRQLNIAIDEPSQVAGFVIIDPNATIAHLRTQMVSELPDIARSCGLDAPDSSCFILNGAPVAKHQESCVRCGSLMPTAVVADRSSFVYRLRRQQALSPTLRKSLQSFGGIGAAGSPKRSGFPARPSLRVQVSEDARRGSASSVEDGDVKSVEMRRLNARAAPEDVTPQLRTVDTAASSGAGSCGNPKPRFLARVLSRNGRCSKTWTNSDLHSMLTLLDGAEPVESGGAAEDSAAAGTQPTDQPIDGQADGKSDKLVTLQLLGPLVNGKNSIAGAAEPSAQSPVPRDAKTHSQIDPKTNGAATGRGATERHRISGTFYADQKSVHVVIPDRKLNGKQIRQRLGLDRGSWLDVVVSDLDVTVQLCAALGIHPLTIEDIIEANHEKVEVFPSYTYIYVTALKPTHLLQHEDDDGRPMMPLHIIVYPGLVVTLQRDVTLLPRIRKLSTSTQRHKSQVSKIVYLILDVETEALVPQVDAIASEVDAVESLVYVLSVSEREDLLRRMGVARHRIAQMNQVVWPKVAIFQTLKSQRHQMESQETLPPAYVQDVLDTLAVMSNRLKLAREFLEGAQSTYIARISLESADNSSEIENRMKTLSSVATIFVPLTTITGIWGMNVVVPGQSESGTFDADDARTYLPFIAICVGMLGVSILMSLAFRRYKFL